MYSENKNWILSLFILRLIYTTILHFYKIPYLYFIDYDMMTNQLSTYFMQSVKTVWNPL